jgi:hypothetical protein
MAPSGARPSPAFDDASPRLPEPASARGPRPFPRPSSPFSSPRDPPHDSTHRVLQDRWQGRLVKPQPLETNENPDGKNQRQLGAKTGEGADTHQGHVPTLGTHHGLGKGADIQPPYCARYPPAEVVGGEGSRGHL